MAKYMVGVAWQMYGYLYLEAESEEEAIKKANDPKWVIQDVEDADYLEDSWEADKESVQEVKNG